MDPLQLPFDQYQRHRIVADVVGALRKRPRLTILDVGGASGVSRSFLGEDDVVAIDITGVGAEPFVRASGAHLPFLDRAFDAAISIDTLEHIPASQRATFLAEIVRVSKDFFVVAAPFASGEIDLTEQALSDFYRKMAGTEGAYLSEHINLGLPGLEETLRLLESLNVETTTLPNAQLDNWLLGMLAFQSLEVLSNDRQLVRAFNAYYNRSFYEQANREPCYRKVIVGSRDHRLDLSGLAKAIQSRDDSPRTVTSLERLAGALNGLQPTPAASKILELQELVERRTRWALQLQSDFQKTESEFLAVRAALDAIERRLPMRLAKAVLRGWRSFRRRPETARKVQTTGKQVRRGAERGDV